MKNSGHWLVCPHIHSHCFAFSAWHIQDYFSQALLPDYSQVVSDNGRHERKTGGWQECLTSGGISARVSNLDIFSYYLSSRDMDSSFIVSFLTVQDLTDSSVLVLLNPGIPHCPIVWLLSSSIICMANSLC